MVAQLVILQHMFSIFLTNAQLLVLLMDISIATLFVLRVILFVKAAQPPLPPPALVVIRGISFISIHAINPVQVLLILKISLAMPVRVLAKHVITVLQQIVRAVTLEDIFI